MKSVFSAAATSIYTNSNAGMACEEGLDWKWHVHIYLSNQTCYARPFDLEKKATIHPPSSLNHYSSTSLKSTPSMLCFHPVQLRIIPEFRWSSCNPYETRTRRTTVLQFVVALVLFTERGAPIETFDFRHALYTVDMHLFFSEGPHTKSSILIISQKLFFREN